MRASRKQLLRGIAGAWLSLGAALQACDSSEEQITAAKYAEHCAIDSDCSGGLVCVFERCHQECNDDKDCKDYGGRCVRVPADDAEKSSTIGVCQLPIEEECTSAEDCKGKQVCAEDQQCRDQCSSKNPCFLSSICATSGECALPDELDSGGNLIVGAGGAGATGGASAGGSGGSSVDTGGPSATGGAASGAGGSTAPDPGSSGAGGATGAGGTASGGTSTAGGSASSAGDSSLGSGGAAGNEGAAAGASGAGTAGDVYVEETDLAEPVPNDDREHTLPLPKHASLWLPTGDRDWFYIDVPDDGPGQIIELLVQEEAGERAYVTAFAAQDDSQIGQILVPEGTTRSIYVTVGSGTRTYIAFSCDRPGRLNFDLVGVTAEQDVYEPNDDRYSAKPVELNTPIVGQQIVPYTMTGGIDSADWFQVTLAAGPAVVNVVEVPANVGLSIYMMDETNTSTALKKFLPGVIGSVPITIAKAGVYRFVLSDHSNSGLAAFYSGLKPESLDKTYTVRFEQ